ncbi:hypothetical protein BKA70DRAFT_1425938 [Coprinopsis sp. MPI-PUGE-AT-0042]|nr:hypothetical protein BKA70DRAFT_1425938 [Coprinopsis sp. MPI-PUGE-AT-0042]
MSTSLSMNLTKPPVSTGSRNAAVLYIYCNKTGHTAKNCYGPGGSHNCSKTQAFYMNDSYSVANGGGLNNDDRGVIEAIEDLEKTIDKPFNGAIDFSAYYLPKPLKISLAFQLLLAHKSAFVHNPSPFNIRETIVYDSVAGQHVFNNRTVFSTFSYVHKEIGMASTNTLVAKGIGVVVF